MTSFMHRLGGTLNTPHFKEEVVMRYINGCVVHTNGIEWEVLLPSGEQLSFNNEGDALKACGA